MFSAAPPERLTFPGLYVGNVEAVNELGRGEIKVSFPSIPDIEAWARPCFPYGHFWVPNTDDKVWIAFQNGDPDFPVWLGVWYPEDTIPAPIEDSHASEPVQRLIHSSSGHFMLFDDTQDAETIHLNHGINEANAVDLQTETLTLSINDSHTLTLNREAETTVIAVDTYQIVLDQANGKIEIISDAVTLTLSNEEEKIVGTVGNSSLTMESGKISLESDEIELKVGENALTLTSDQMLLAVGSSTLSLESSGMTLESPTIDLNP